MNAPLGVPNDDPRSGPGGAHGGYGPLNPDRANRSGHGEGLAAGEFGQRGPRRGQNDPPLTEGNRRTRQSGSPVQPQDTLGNRHGAGCRFDVDALKMLGGGDGAQNADARPPRRLGRGRGRHIGGPTKADRAIGRRRQPGAERRQLGPRPFGDSADRNVGFASGRQSGHPQRRCLRLQHRRQRAKVRDLAKSYLFARHLDGGPKGYTPVRGRQ